MTSYARWLKIRDAQVQSVHLDKKTRENNALRNDKWVLVESYIKEESKHYMVKRSRSTMVLKANA